MSSPSHAGVLAQAGQPQPPAAPNPQAAPDVQAPAAEPQAAPDAPAASPAPDMQGAPDPAAPAVQGAPEVSTPVTPGQEVPPPPPVADPGTALPDSSGLLSGTPLESLSAFLDLGGPVVALLMLLSVFALTIVLVKLWQFTRMMRGTRRRIPNAVRLWLAGDHKGALQAIGNIPGPVAHLVGNTMLGVAQRRDDAVLREQTELRAASLLAGMRSYLRGLESVAQVAPLLGLFGTVLGMIEAFRSLEAAGAQVDPGDLAGGIWVALLTTAVGLAIAMPVSLVLQWFEGRIDRFRMLLEGWATDILTHPPVKTVKLTREQAETAAQQPSLEPERADAS